jgi:hypothetical protein
MIKLSKTTLQLLAEIQQQIDPDMTVDDVVEFLAESWLGHIPNGVQNVTST